MKSFFKKMYEKNNSSLSILYLIIKFLFKLSGKYKELDEEINIVIEQFESSEITKKQKKKQYKKLLVYRYIYSIRPDEYYLYGFEDASYEDRKKFMTRQQTARYYSGINDSKYRRVFDNKNLTYEIFKDYYKRKLVCIKDKNDLNILKEFIKENKRFILKPFDGHSGDGVEIIDTKLFKDEEQLLEYTMEKIPFVAEELIKQSPKLGCFHEKSVNTIRVVTFQYNHDFSILWAFIRTGQGSSSVDNMGASGLGAFIDIKTGEIIGDGIDWKGQKVEEHPDSKIKFKGFQIPHWEELIEFVRKLASEIADMHCVGWDLALQEDGWVLVEANARPQCVTVQTYNKKGYKRYYENMYNIIKRLERKV